MRKLIVQQWVTVDNIAAEEDGGLSFVAGEPFDDTVTDDPFQNAMMAFIDSVDTMLLGAATYAQTKDYWPHADDQGAYGRKLNGHTKFIASTKLASATWGDFAAPTVTGDPVATVRELKQRDGKDIWTWGSLTLMRWLLTAGVVDEVRLLICPAARGRGTRIFADSHDLDLVDVTGYDNGVVIARYAIR